MLVSGGGLLVASGQTLPMSAAAAHQIMDEHMPATNALKISPNVFAGYAIASIQLCQLEDE